MSLFKVSNQSTPPIDQTEVRIPSLNGLSYSPGQQIQIFVDASRVQHIIGKDSYLEFECKISLNSETSGSLVKLQLDSQTGGNCLLRNVRLFSGNKKNLLEEIYLRLHRHKKKERLLNGVFIMSHDHEEDDKTIVDALSALGWVEEKEDDEENGPDAAGLVQLNVLAIPHGGNGDGGHIGRIEQRLSLDDRVPQGADDVHADQDEQGHQQTLLRAQSGASMNRG